MVNQGSSRFNSRDTRKTRIYCTLIIIFQALTAVNQYKRIVFSRSNYFYLHLLAELLYVRHLLF